LDTIKSTYKNVGIDLDKIPILLDSEEREGKSQHGFCFGIDPPEDIRILLNLDDGPMMANILMHEYGHGIYGYYGRHEEFILRGSPTSFMNEAVANFFGDFSNEAEWMKKYSKIPKGLLQEYQDIRKYRTIRDVRASIARMIFEREVYRKPGQNLTKLYWKLISKILGVPSHPELKTWAGIIHFTSHPVYLQNYFIADVISAQFRAFLKKQNKTIIGNPKTGKFFIESIIQHAATKHWDEILKSATGEKLNPKYFVEELLAE